jgi:Rrf2 family protein
MFSKTCQYAIKATVFIALQSQKAIRTSLRDIALAIDSPEAFTAKILQTLAKHNVIQSHKGPTGGFEISTESLKTLCLLDIVVAIEGDRMFTGCGLGLRMCNEQKPCPVHTQFKEVRNGLQQMLSNTLVATLGEDLLVGNSFLKV